MFYFKYEKEKKPKATQVPVASQAERTLQEDGGKAGGCCVPWAVFTLEKQQHWTFLVFRLTCFLRDWGCRLEWLPGGRAQEDLQKPDMRVRGCSPRPHAQGLSVAPLF